MDNDAKVKYEPSQDGTWQPVLNFRTEERQAIKDNREILLACTKLLLHLTRVLDPPNDELLESAGEQLSEALGNAKQI